MAPQPTPRATLAFLGCAVLQLVGLWAQVPLLIWLGAAGLVGISICLSLTLRAGAILRGLRLEFGWDAAGDSAAEGLPLSLGREKSVVGYFQNHGPRPVILFSLRPALPEAIGLVSGPAAIRAEARGRTAFEVDFRSTAIGRWVVQGLSVSVPGPLGLFLAPLYFPTPLALRVLPSSPEVVRARGALSVAEGGSLRAPLAVRGGGRGSEFRELRALQPGDPYHAIAWKPSARRGQLLARVNEQEHERTLVVILDVGVATRAGPAGERPLDRGLDLSANLLLRAIAVDGQAALLTVDSRLVDHVPARAGENHVRALQRSLLAASQVVDADLTCSSEAHVQTQVLRYLRRQGGLPTFDTHSTSQMALNQQLLARAVRIARDEDDRYKTVGRSPQDILLRRFCRRRGIALSYDNDANDEVRAQALGQVLQLAIGNSRDPRDLVLILSEAYALPSLQLQRALSLAKVQGHRVQIVQLVSGERSLLSAHASFSTEQASAATRQLQQQRKRAEQKRFFRRLRCPTYTLTPDTAIPSLCIQLERAPSAAKTA